MKFSKTHGIFAGILIVLFVLSLTLVIGTDSNWGKTEVSHMVLVSPDGDEINTMLYKPNTATAEHPAPCAVITHGGNDMLEQMGTYALELSRRGYVVMTWDYSGCHNSDIPTGGAETTPGAVSGLPTMGAETVWNTVKSFNFVDFDKIITMGHSMGGQYTMAFALNHQEDVFLQVNLGMNNYGSTENQVHNFHFSNILGVADESALARSENNVASLFQNEQMRRIFFADYTSEADAVPSVEINKTYTVTGTDGRTYNRTAYMPESCHAYYLVTNDAIRTVLYTITSQVGIGMDSGVSSFADRGNISLIWQWKDLGFLLIFLTTVLAMFLTASALLETKAFSGLHLQKAQYISFPRRSRQWYVSLFLLAVVPVALFRAGILSAQKFLGVNISGLWLLSGTNNSYISWQWTVSIGMLVIFLGFHFLWGKKNGGNLRTYGFATSDEKAFDIGYIVRALFFGLATVGSGYLVFLLFSAYTQQGIHIATFMLSAVKPNRTFCVIMYFLFQSPYFLTSSLAFKSIGLTDTDDSRKGLSKAIGLGSAISVGGLFLLWLVFILILMIGHTLTGAAYFAKDRMYIYTIAILPLAIGMLVANALNLYIGKKTNSIWSGLFTALLWGAWIIVSCGGISKYIY